MVLTEFDEEVFRNGMKQEGFQEGFEKGVSQGITQGISQGQSSLADAIKRLHSGETPEDLLKSGFDKATIELALECK
ncbi:MAG: hypothetical protein ILP17_12220 [Lachnospiraceae bacterium]|nr:hypothetical protein [Lachnospiraceae bacterium]